MYHEEQAIEKEQAIKETEVGKRRESRETERKEKRDKQDRAGVVCQPG